MPKHKAKHPTSLSYMTIGRTDAPIIFEPIDGRLCMYANLAPDWWDCVSEAAPGEMTDEQAKEIARSILAYVLARWSEIARVPYNPVAKPLDRHDVRSYFEALTEIEEALSLLARSTRIGVRSIVWDDLCGINPIVDLAKIEKTLSDLYTRIQSLKAKHKRLSESPPNKPSNFEEFVLHLAAFFRSAGWKVAAAKSSRAKDPKSSNFVRFVYAIMTSLHPSVREHSQSEAAMAKAISPIIARSLSGRTLRDGKRSNSPRKSPATSR